MEYTQEQLNWLYTNNPEEYNRYVLALQAQQPAPVQQVAPIQQAVPVQQAMSPVAVQPQTAGNLAALANAAAEVEDHAEIRTGSIARAGAAWLRLKSYIEIGVHPKKNPTHSPAMVALVEFELHHPDHITDYDGVRKPRLITVRVPKTHGNNSGFPKFFKALQRAIGEQYKHISQMIGQGCLGEIIDNKDDNGKTWENLDRDGAWTFSSSRFLNPATGAEEVVDIPPLHGVPQMFIMDNQNLLANPAGMKEMWDSIYVDGTRTVGGGTTGKPEKVISNNYYQERLMESINWETSQAKQVLDSMGCITMTDEIAKKKHSPTQEPAAQVTGAMNALPQLTPASGVHTALPVGATSATGVPNAMTAVPVATAPTELPVAQPTGQPTAAMQVQPAPETVPAVLSATPAQVLQQPAIPQQVTPVQAMPQAVQQAVPVQQAAPVAQPQAVPQSAAPMDATTFMASYPQ